MPKKIPYKNQSPTGWWIYSEIEFFVSQSQKKPTASSRHLVWENTRIIQAENRHADFRKAMALGKSTHPSKTAKGQWLFAGISELLPIYEKLEDGAELLWAEHGTLSLKKIKRMACVKKRLAVFNDS